MTAGFGAGSHPHVPQPDGGVLVAGGGARLSVRRRLGVVVVITVAVTLRLLLRVLVRQFQSPRRAEPEPDSTEERAEGRKGSGDDADAHLDDGPDDYAGCSTQTVAGLEEVLDYVR